MYDLERIRLDNGFQVFLKQRPEANNVAFRLAVNIGTRNFGCELRETPHLLEHLLFSGTRTHSEAELEHRIADLGGSWNAVTGTEHTVYQLDIFDRFALDGLDALYEILTDTVITPEKIDRAKSIVYREEGGRPGPFRRLLYGAGVGKGAWKKADEWLLPGTGAICPGLVNLELISLEELGTVYKRAYIPGNMTLIVVGNFRKKPLLDKIRATFGALPAAEVPNMQTVTPPEPPAGPTTVASTLSPFFGSSGSFNVAYRTGGRRDADAAALIVLGTYLNEKFYEQVRVKAGLSYAPEAVMFFQPDYGIFYATADGNVHDLGRVRELMLGIVETLRKEKVAVDETERTKRKILLQWAQGHETNAGLATLYADLLFRADLGTTGAMRLPDYEREIEAVAPADLDRVIDRYIRPERRIEIRSVPTVSYATFFLVIGGVVLFLVVVFLARLRAAARRKRSLLPMYLRK